MTTTNSGEQWKSVKFDTEFSNNFRVEVSNLGNVRTFNKLSNGKIIKGSMINGYRSIRLKLFQPRDEQTSANLGYFTQQVATLSKKLKWLEKSGEPQNTITETAKLLDGLKAKLSRKQRKDLKDRTVYYSVLVHRLVADYFLDKPQEGQTIVAHLDYDKLNNSARNLKWMTPEENYQHQKGSPYVIAENQRRQKQKDRTKSTKLSVTKVMLLKKLLNQGKPIKQLVKLFKVTDTQILRIKRGENWSDIEPAK
jgi:hypothetical protein